MLTVTENFNEIKKKADDIDGWLGENESLLLYNLAKNLKQDADVLEIGSWHGKSMLYITTGMLEGSSGRKFFSVDPFVTAKDEPNGAYEFFMDNVKKHNRQDIVVQIREKSQLATDSINNNFEMIFIDGFHRYDVVSLDYKYYFPKLINGGYILFHDIACYEGPTKLVCQLIRQQTPIRFMGLTDLTAWGQKVKTLTEEDIVNNQKVLENIIVATKKRPIKLKT